VNDVACASGSTAVQAGEAVEVFLEGLRTALVKTGRIEVRGFGVFTVRARKRGIGRNPRTGEGVAIGPGMTVRFKPGKELQALALVLAENEKGIAGEG